MATVAVGAAIAQGVSSVIEGISANEQSKVQSKNIQRQAHMDSLIAKADFQAASGESIAQAGGSGLSLTGGSNLAIFTQSALNEANTLSDIRFQGAVDSANARQQGKNALIGGVIGGIASAAGGVSAANNKKRQIQSGRDRVSGGKLSPSNTAKQRSSARGSRRSLLGPQE